MTNQTIIGVHHHEHNLGALINYVTAEYDTPKRLMLELPLYWRELKDTPITEDSYFYTLAETFEKRGSEIIAGDINHGLIVSRSLCDRANQSLSKQADNWPDLFNLIGERLWLRLSSEIIVRWNLLNPYKNRQRDYGMLKVLEETKPELTIVGDSHAQYITRKRPDLDYTRFRSDTFTENLTDSINMFTIKRMLGKRPQKNIVVKV